MSQVLSLFRLQNIDTQSDQILNRIRKIKEILLEDALLQKARADENLANLELSEAKKAMTMAEEAVKSQKLKIELDESSLYGGKVRTPKELQDLQNEVESLKRYLGVLEERQLECMLDYDEKLSRFQTSHNTLLEVEKELALSHASLISEREKLEHDLGRIDEERKVASGSIPPESLQLYEMLRKQKRGVAVAQVEECACLGCGSELTPAECQSAKSPSQIKTCPSCGRILYAG